MREFSWDSTIDRYVEVIEDLLPPAQSSRRDREIHHVRAVREVVVRVLFRSVYQLRPATRRHALFLLYHHRPGNFRHPKTFSEKMNWRILNDRREILSWTCDKLETKRHADATGLATPRTLWAGTDLRELENIDLPDLWVLKPNHRSGAIHFGAGQVADASELPPAREDWLTDAQSVDKGEWAYSRARPCLLVEQRLDREPPPDLKVFVFGGRAEVIQLDTDRFKSHARRFYSRNWQPMQFVDRFSVAPVTAAPPRLAEMIQAAERVAAGFDFLRVDLYLFDDRIYLGEVTPYVGGGLERFFPRSADRMLGDLWDLPDVSDQS